MKVYEQNRAKMANMLTMAIYVDKYLVGSGILGSLVLLFLGVEAMTLLCGDR